MSTRDVVIIGGGISGLSLLHFIRRARPEMNILLLESEHVLGGTMGTDHIDGFSIDWGPNGFLDREPLTLKLCHDLGLDSELERANESVQKRFILRGGRLRQVPMSPRQFLTSDVLSLAGRLRVLAEPFFGRSAANGDQSIYDFARRHIGLEAADYLVQPMVSGIFGGRAERLSLESCFPVMSEMEREHGSLFRAMIAKKRKAKSEGHKSGGPAGPAGWLTSFKGGMRRLIVRLEEQYSDYIAKSSPATSIHQQYEKYSVRINRERTVDADNVVLTTPAFHSAKLLSGLAPQLASDLSAIPYAPISVVTLGYNGRSIEHELDGFGFLVPITERRTVLGSIWTTSIFEKRAPEGQVQFRSMVGGDGDHASANLSDDELVGSVHQDLSRILQIEDDPTLVRIYRWSRGIPQYRVGHQKRLQSIESQLEKLKGIYIAGNAYYGVGINDCVKRSAAIADQICSSLGH